MLYNNLCLSVSKFAAKSQSRPELCGVFITPKKVAATDSFRLVEVSVPTNVKVENFPRYNNKSAMKGFKPFIAPAQEFGKIKLPTKKMGLPELNCLAVSHLDDKMVEFFTSNLETGEIKVLRRIEGRYPDYEKVIPTGKPVAEVVINAEYVKEMADLMSKFGKLKDMVIKFYGQDKPVMFESKNPDTGQVARGLIMCLKV